MSDGPLLTTRLPLTLALSPEGRGKSKPRPQRQASGRVCAERLGQGHPLPSGERVWVRGHNAC